MLTRRHVMRGSGFKRQADLVAPADREERRQRNLDVLLAGKGRAAVMGGTTSGTPVAKERASQSQAYQDAVRAIGYCMRCGCTLRKGEGQFCHADVRRGWLGCAGCHYYVGTKGDMPKAQRRRVEDYLAWRTRCALRRRGTWPKSLPDTWVEADADPIPNPETVT
jgi:hypothetical protein